MSASVPLYSYRSVSGISIARSHNERALDTTLRRFPHLLSTCRDCGADGALIEETIEQRLDLIVAEYHRVTGETACTRSY